MMKKTIYLLLVFLCILTLTSCSKMKKDNAVSKNDALEFLRQNGLYTVTEFDDNYELADKKYDYEFTVKIKEKRTKNKLIVFVGRLDEEVKRVSRMINAVEYCKKNNYFFEIFTYQDYKELLHCIDDFNYIILDVLLEMSIAVFILYMLSVIITTSEASILEPAPIPPIDIPMSARASTGESFIPSPT